MDVTGSPGARFMTVNVTTVIMNISGMEIRKRRTMYFVTERFSPMTPSLYYAPVRDVDVRRFATWWGSGGRRPCSSGYGAM